MKQFQLAVFGKQGCDKCDVLKKRLNKILAEQPYSGFEISNYDMGTSDGLVRFCQCEILNPQRIPSFMVFSVGDGGLAPVPHRLIVGDGEDTVETGLAMETDYSAGGVIKPETIRAVLDEALQTLAVKV
ncbi:hypothetical protein ACFL4X_02160 [Gemmatimonadota bacterium]